MYQGKRREARYVDPFSLKSGEPDEIERFAMVAALGRRENTSDRKVIQRFANV